MSHAGGGRYVPGVGPPSPLRLALIAVAAVGFAGAWEARRDHGEVEDVTIVTERRDGKVWRYAVDGGGEFAVAPIAGLLHGYPRVGDSTRVRVRPDGERVWYAVTARYPFTVLFSMVAFFTGVALALAPLRRAE